MNYDSIGIESKVFGDVGICPNTNEESAHCIVANVLNYDIVVSNHNMMFTFRLIHLGKL